MNKFEDDMEVPEEGVICKIKLREPNNSDILIDEKGELKPLDKLYFKVINIDSSHPYPKGQPRSAEDGKRGVAKPFSYRSGPSKTFKIRYDYNKVPLPVREIDSEKVMRVLLK